MNRVSTAIAFALIGPAMLAAQEVTLSAPDADETLTNSLRDASTTLAIKAEDAPEALDYVAAARTDYRSILTALYAAGYYAGTVSIKVDGQEAANLAPLDAPDSVAAIDITVTPGPRFEFGNLSLTPVIPGTALPDRFATGRIARSEVIRQSVTGVVSSWRDAGYAKARASGQQITARHAEKQLDVTVTIAPGPRLTFGPLSVSGNEAVRTSRIIAIAGLPEGNVYSPAQITKAENRLRRTGAFDSVSLVEAENIGPGDTLPVTAQLAESKPRRFGFGLELSTIEGLSLSSFWMHRNFFGGAERFRVDGAISGISGDTGGVDYELGVSLGRPAVLGPDTDFLATATISRDDEPEYLIDQIAIETTLTRLIRDDLEVEGGIGLIAAHEETAAGDRDYILATFPLSATLDRRNDPTNASDGYYINIDATPFVSLQGGDNGARLYADARAYRSFGETENVTVAGRMQTGTVIGAGLDTAPADFLFYSGGGGTVRGQQYQSLGIDSVVNGVDVRSGGLSFVGAQLEARVTVRPKIGIVGFYDVGYVGNTSNPFGDGDWQSGAGIGVRYDTGIGPIRLDIATPASGNNAGQRVEVYIGIGQSF